MIDQIYYLNADKILAKSDNNSNSQKIPSILHLIWIGDNPIPHHFTKNVNKWKELMPHWHFMVWTNNHLNESFIEKKYLDLIFNSKSGAQKADILRYYIIKKYGGFYIDSDIIPLKSLDDLLLIDNDVILCNDMPINFEYISNSMFAAIPNHPVLDLICESLFSAKLNSKDIHLQTGPGLFGRCIFSYNWNEFPAILQPNAFYNLTNRFCIDFINVSNELYNINKKIKENKIHKDSEIINLLNDKFYDLLSKIRESHPTNIIEYDNVIFGIHSYNKDW